MKLVHVDAVSVGEDYVKGYMLSSDLITLIEKRLKTLVGNTWVISVLLKGCGRVLERYRRLL